MVKSQQYNVGTGVPANPIAGPFPGPTIWCLTNSGANPAFLGDSTVSTTTGYQIAAGQTHPPIQVPAGEAIYARAGTATTLQVMILGANA